MSLFGKTEDIILSESLEYIRSVTGLTAVGPGSRIQAIMNVLKSQVGSAYSAFDRNVLIGFINFASGQYLDMIAEMMSGIYRFPAYASEVNSYAETVEFYTDDINFGAINNGFNIIIPVNTEIWGFANSEKISFITTEQVVLDKSQQRKYVSVKSVSKGSNTNLSPGTLKYHGFTNYALSKENLLQVVNIKSIDNGTDSENDNNFRYRIIHHQNTLAKGNATALRMAALSVPGVSDVHISEHYNGIGTTGMLVKTITPIASDETIDMVQFAVDSVKSYGEKVIVVKPKYVSVSIVIDGNFINNENVHEHTTGELSVKSYLLDYINNLDVGQTLDLGTIDSYIRSLSQNASDDIRLNPIKAVYVTRTIYNEFTVKEQIYNSYTPAYDEKFIIEDSEDSIKFI